MLAKFEYNGIEISRRDDGFVNANQMCEAVGKRLDNFMANAKTKDYIKRLERSLGIQVSDSIKGGVPSSQGTWMHKMLAIKLAQWLDVDFEIWCNAHLLNLMETGSTSLDIDPIAKIRAELCGVRSLLYNRENDWDKEDWALIEEQESFLGGQYE